MEKFEDEGKYLSDFENYRIIECPNCSKPIDFFTSRLICDHCGYLKELTVHKSWFTIIPISDPIKDYLSINCCGNNLWALNLEHLNFIEDYVKAELRIRTPNINRSLASRLPKWIKNKKNRPEILKSITKLKNKLNKNKYRKTYKNAT